MTMKELNSRVSRRSYVLDSCKKSSPVRHDMRCLWLVVRTLNPAIRVAIILVGPCTEELAW